MRPFLDFFVIFQTFCIATQTGIPPPDFAPDSLEADKCSVRLYVGKGTAFLYGTLIR